MTPVMHLLASGLDRRAADRALAEMTAGLTLALRDEVVSLDQAEREMFNLDFYQAAESAGVDPRLIEAVGWGMELADVIQLVPNAIGDSYDNILRLCREVIAAPVTAAA